MLAKFKLWLIRHVYFLPDPKQVLFFTKDGKPVIDGEVVTDQELKSLREEAIFLEKTRLWALMQNTVARNAQKTMFERAVNYENTATGRIMFLILQEQRNLLAYMKGQKIKE